MTTENTPFENKSNNEPSSHQSDVNMTIGQLISKTRTDKGLSLKTISQQTKIHIGLLENLEADQFDKLPSKAYVRGFVKSAAKILSLDQDYALELLDKAYEANLNSKKSEKPNQEMKNETARNTLTTMSATPLETVRSVTLSSSLFLTKAAIVILIVGVVGINVKNLFEKSKEEVVKLPEVLSTLQKKKVAPKPVVKVEEPKTEEFQEPIKVNIIEDKNVKTDITVNDLNLKTISLGEKQFIEDKSVTTEKLEELLPAKNRVQPLKGMETLFLNASEGESWLTYKVDDKKIQKFVLRQGRTLFLRGAVIRVFIGNIKSLKVFHNNKPVTLPANDKSTVRNIVVPEDMKTKFMSPLFVFQPDGSVLTSEDYVKLNQVKKPETSLSTPASTPGTSPATKPLAPVAPANQAPAPKP